MDIMKMMGIDPEQQTYDVVKEALENIAKEYNCTFKDIFIMISPIDGEFNHKYIICKRNAEGVPTGIVRDITLKEILGKEDE